MRRLARATRAGAGGLRVACGRPARGLRVAAAGLRQACGWLRVACGWLRLWMHAEGLQVARGWPAEGLQVAPEIILRRLNNM